MEIEYKNRLKTARITGLWYLLLAISGMIGFLFLHDKIYNINNPGQTLTNLTSHEVTAKLRLLAEFTIIIAQSLTAIYFYKLFYKINQPAALAICVWGIVNAVAIMVSAFAMGASINIATASELSIETKTILIKIFAELISNAWAIGGLFFGLWLLPMGYIIIQSKLMPFWLGVTLIVGGVGYILSTYFNFSSLNNFPTDILTIPATIGEFWIIGYMLIFGIRNLKLE